MSPPFYALEVFQCPFPLQPEGYISHIFRRQSPEVPELQTVPRRRQQTHIIAPPELPQTRSGLHFADRVEFSSCLYAVRRQANRGTIGENLECSGRPLAKRQRERVRCQQHLATMLCESRDSY